MKPWLFGLLMVGLYPLIASAQTFVPLEYSRSVDGRIHQSGYPYGCFHGTSEGADASTEAGLWHAMIAFPRIEDIEDPEANNSFGEMEASVDQYSVIGDEGLSMHGWVDYAFADDCFQELWYTSAELASNYHVRFLLTDTSIMEITGQLSALASDAHQWRMVSDNSDRLLTSAASMVIRRITASDIYAESLEVLIDPFTDLPTDLADDRTLATAAQLPAGIYDLDINVWLNVDIHAVDENEWVEQLAELTYVINVDFDQAEGLPPCMLTDTDGDGDIDLQDFQSFQNCYTGPQA